MLDLVVHNGLVFDGMGSAAFLGSLFMEDGTIQFVGHGDQRAPAARTIDACGRYVTPGFIDLHGHNDLDIIESPLCEDKLRQGVTTQTVGHCGVSAAPIDPRHPAGIEAILTALPEWSMFGEYLSSVVAARPATNVVPFVGYANLRSVTRIEDDCKATSDQIDLMVAALRAAMEAGAFGLTTGLTYPPQHNASTEELVSLCRSVKEHAGLYATHIRHNTDLVSKGVKEAIQIAERSGVRTHIAHLQFRRNDSIGSAAVLELIQQARSSGADITCDQYPYLAGLGPISPFFPAWVFRGSWEDRIEILQDGATRDKIAEHMRTAVEPFIGWDEILVPVPSNPDAVESVQAIAHSSGIQPHEVLIETLGSLREGATCFVFGKQQSDLAAIAKRPYCAVGSDGSLRTHPIHPRTYGTFVRYLRAFVQETECLTMCEAIRRMTGLPASILGLKSRGMIEPGNAADILIIDPEALDDRATYDDPTAHPEGIDYVIIGGMVVLEDGRHTTARPGRVLSR